jgi:hypothetical protein
MLSFLSVFLIFYPHVKFISVLLFESFLRMSIVDVNFKNIYLLNELFELL